MNIRLFNVKGNDKEENKVYSEDDKTIVSIKDHQYFEVANDDVGGDGLYIRLQFKVSDLGLVIYSEKKKLLNDIQVLIIILEEIDAELAKAFL